MFVVHPALLGYLLFELSALASSEAENTTSGKYLIYMTYMSPSLHPSKSMDFHEIFQMPHNWIEFINHLEVFLFFFIKKRTENEHFAYLDMLRLF